MIVRLSEVKVGQTARILRVEGRGSLRRRLIEMGVEPGALIKIERIAPLGDPIEVKVKGYYLSLRKSEACKVLVEVVDSNEH
ncbi:MAG: iron transporter FeoA [Candidatus Methanomethylicota archaeon]|uniref:Iron transporter FeoA n=1 Tax=Thermoproteota archaeon TaxID=2056631 RepID=A0A497F337_9CREN|nr:MAG: iron transporter FeoA [Candidatus Verstraetearchaeota archaeon]